MDQRGLATPQLQSWQAGRVTLDPGGGWGVVGVGVGVCVWGGSLPCRAGALGLPRRIRGVRRLSVIPHSGSSTWDLFSCWMGRQAAREDSHFRPASVAVNASRQRRADTRPRVPSPSHSPLDSLPSSHRSPVHTQKKHPPHGWLGARAVISAPAFREQLK